jgi:inositol oxygenase
MNTQFRDYSNVSENIKLNYRLAREYQNTLLYQYILNNFNNRDKKIYKFWDIMDKLNNFIDISDPDISLPNTYHLFQSAEKARQDKQPEWFQLVCLIHDLGKIQAFIDKDKDNGLSVDKQWAIVGDTFILGCKIPKTIIFPEFNNLNYENLKKDNLGIYKENCGLNNTMVSWGHDEFLYRTLLNNNHKLPEEALYIIRYHSLYLWHKENEYTFLENDKDKKMKYWVQKFNKYDLYTKRNEKLDIEELKPYYSKLFIDFFGSLNILI